MKTHTNNFKNTMKTIGRELDSIITYTIDGTTTTLTNEQINSVTPHYESSLLKSVMKQLDIDSNVEIPLETIINYQFGLKIGNSYEYLDFGNYVVYKVEKQEDTNSWKITCYDKMLYAMKNYESLNITYPITIRNYINAICNKLGLTFANINDTFANYNRQISNEVYLDGNGNSLGYTYRDVLDELAQVTASIICINSDDELEIRYPNETNDVIDEEYLKDVNVNFGEKYGPINSIVLTRASESDSVYLRNEESVQTNGLCEIKIKDNQIMNLNNRADYLPDILEELDGLQYYYNDFSSTGITYYDVYDKYQISIGESLYDCIMFNDEINITQGLQENIHTEVAEESETDYKHASKDDRQRNQAYIIAKKNDAEIQALASKIVDISATTNGIGSITLENAYKGLLHRLEISGSMSCLYPSSSLLPKSDLLPIGIYLIVDETNYVLDIDYLDYTSVEEHDTFVYEDGKCWIERADGTIEEREGIEIYVESDSSISIEPFTNAIMYCEYLLENEYTSTFANQVEVTSELNLLADTLEAKVSQVADEDGNVTSASIILAVNNDESQADIQANKINLNGVVTANENFKILGDGSMEAKNGTFNGDITLLDNGIANENEHKFNLKKDDNNLYLFSDGLYFEYPVNGMYVKTFRVDMRGTMSWPFMLTLEDPSTSKTTSIDPSGITTPDIYGENLYITGTKNRVVDVDGKQILMNAYETTTPYFGDIGSGKTDNNGYCKIYIENEFKKTIEDDYKVFIQECGEGKLYVKKSKSYFEVFGTENLDFDWEIKAIQKNYKNVRMKEFEKEMNK